MQKLTLEMIDQIAKNLKKLTKILLEREFDRQNQLAFGIYILQETSQNLAKLLQIEFDSFFELI